MALVETLDIVGVIVLPTEVDVGLSRTERDCTSPCVRGVGKEEEIGVEGPAADLVCIAESVRRRFRVDSGILGDDWDIVS